MYHQLIYIVNCHHKQLYNSYLVIIYEIRRNNDTNYIYCYISYSINIYIIRLAAIGIINISIINIQFIEYIKSYNSEVMTL